MNKEEWTDLKRRWLEMKFECPRAFDIAMECLEDEEEFSPKKAWADIQHE